MMQGSLSYAKFQVSDDLYLVLCFTTSAVGIQTRLKLKGNACGALTWSVAD